MILNLNIKKLVKECKAIANEHGFEVTWKRKEGPMNPIEALCKIISECGEAMEAYVSQTNNPKWKEEFEEEIADLLIRTFHLIGDLKIDIEKVLEKKMKYNKDRPYRHRKLT